MNITITVSALDEMTEHAARQHGIADSRGGDEQNPH